MAACCLCETRRPRRYCPGVRSDICPLCCGNEREVTVECPFECEYLQEARRHERLPEIDPDNFPNGDIEVTEEFLLDHEQLAAFMARALLQSALAVPGAVDNDVRDALGPMIRTYRTLQSGLIYETRPANPYAAAIQQALQARLQDFRERVAQSTGLHSVRDADILGILVFLERMELQHNNGRRRGRAFLDFLRGEFPDIAQPAPPLVSG